MIEIGVTFGFAIYGMIWFVCLFVVLPFGVVSQAEDGSVEPGSPASAPTQPRIGLKMFITTILAAIVYAFTYWVLTSGFMRHIDFSF